MTAKPVDTAAIAELLRFRGDLGEIWMGEQRMMLLHGSSFAALRNEIITSLGADAARGLLTRMGFESGRCDARLALAMFGNEVTPRVMELGPVLHTFAGFSRTRMLEYSYDVRTQDFFARAAIAFSWEDEAQRDSFGIGSEAACWSHTGYASGYTTELMGTPVFFKETTCESRGDSECILEGRIAEEWPDVDIIMRDYEKIDFSARMLELQAKVEALRTTVECKRYKGDLIGNSPRFNEAIELLERAAESTINVLLLGETGVGKEVFAHWLHNNGIRANRPFVVVNCAAIPHDLIEAELFGVEEGAYTGARVSRPGRFERADGGTLFLDEIGDLPPQAQVKLLRALQSGEIERLGGTKVRKVDVRLVAATNVNLKEAMASKAFRSDLYFRLATFPIEIAPLRERRTDIPLLARLFLDRYSASSSKVVTGFTDRAIRALQSYDWPGNIRELENMVERGVLLAPPHGLIETRHLAPELDAGDDDAVAEDGAIEGRGATTQICRKLLREDFSLDEFERTMLVLAMERAGGNISAAARLLGVTRPQLRYRLKAMHSENA